MQMFRVKAIYEMVVSVTNTFVEHINSIMDETTDPDFELIKHSTSSALCKTLKKFNYRHGFQNREVLKLELEGNNYIKKTMGMLWRAINENETDDPFAKFAYGRISENYRRVYEASRKDTYAKCQLLCDMISGMTESYLITLHDELSSLSYDLKS